MRIRRSIPDNIPLGAQAILLVGLTLALYLVPTGKDAFIAWPVIALFYIYFFNSFFSPVRIRPNIPSYTSIETLFLMFYYLLFINPYQLDLLGMSDLSRNTFLTFAYESGSNQALLAAGVGFVAFHLGLSCTERRQMLHAHPISQPVSDLSYYHGLSYIILTLLAGFVLTYEIAGLQSADEGRYTQITNGGPIADGIYLLISMLSIMAIARAIATLCNRKNIDLPTVLSLVVVCYWSARILVNGDRNTFFLIAIAAGGGVFTFIRRTSWITLVACALFSIILYNAVEVIRKSQDRSFSNLVEKMLEERSNKEENSSSSFTITTTTLRATFDIIPERMDYGYGKYKLIGFAGIVPLIRGSLLGSNNTLATTADVLSYYMLGQNAGWSVGSNLITDIYMDFGVIGIPILMCLLGRFAGAIQQNAMRNPLSTKTITFYLLVLANFGELSRYALDFPVRMLVWTYLLFFVYEAILGKGRGNRQGLVRMRASGRMSQ
ncbi:O-antigen polysaccharide polymerase Wzy [Bradyrhizobium sp. 193]|uniref:O-antigen polysaccharide polymerase Wzy n=1 Tax=Bradyrhizobium sp. 193 TaxID=2782661 RepID=UPI001FFB4ECE|nr:O-antigen polysaccharide polymerase Wzy [Bradyrhizobium sp. 193]MCK1485646.1 O-antigen polysaccharide polymerase Wzy [Bradyrhizobium sp. 193]